MITVKILDLSMEAQTLLTSKHLLAIIEGKWIRRRGDEPPTSAVSATVCNSTIV
jgi:hypothetical protein